MVGGSHEAQRRAEPVAGTVQLMTEQPLEVPPLSQLDTLRNRWAYQVSRRPWIIPAALLAAGALVLLLLRRR